MPNITIKKTTVDAMYYRSPASSELQDWLAECAVKIVECVSDKRQVLTIKFIDDKFKKRKVTAFNGQYIIKHDDGTFSVLPAEFFEVE